MIDYELVFFSAFALIIGYFGVPVIIKGFRQSEEDKDAQAKDLKNKKNQLANQIPALLKKTTGYSDKNAEFQITEDLIKTQQATKKTISGYIRSNNSKLTQEISQAKLELAERCIKKIKDQMPDDDQALTECLKAVTNFHRDHRSANK